MVLEYLPTNWDYWKNYIQGVNVGKYSSTMDPLGMNIWEECGNIMENHGKTMGENCG